MLINFPV